MGAANKKTEKMDIEKLVDAAVKVACEACMKGIEEKLQAAINLGVTIGAKAGAEVGAAAAIKAAERERAKMRKVEHDRRYHNTKLLLRNYRALNAHYHNAVFDVQKAQEDETFVDIMEAMNAGPTDDAFYIESIKQSCIRTKVIMAHVNRMLDIYKIICQRSKRREEQRRWDVLNDLYLSTTPISAAEIAREQHIDKRTVYKDIDAAIEDLTTLLFGITGIRVR